MIPLPTLSDKLSPISTALDAATHSQRVNWMRGLGKREQDALWALADGQLPLSTGYFHGAPGEVVVHIGHNSLPLFTSFKKPICLNGAVVQGFNDNVGLAAWFGGPGHFIVRREEGPQGRVYFDYTTVPESAPPSFPPLIDNDGGTRKLVYGGMKDYMRRVSRHCTIGEAWRRGKREGSWFMLMRDGDPPEDPADAAG